MNSLLKSTLAVFAASSLAQAGTLEVEKDELN